MGNAKMWKIRKLLAEQNRLCHCLLPIPSPGRCRGTAAANGSSVSYTAKHCTRCGGLIAVTVR